MYRAAALALKLSGIDINTEPRDVSAIQLVVNRFHFEMPGDETILNGVNVTPMLGGEDAGQAASRVGTFAEVRTKLKNEQRRLAAGQEIICEGRDQGTSVFPEADVKFFFQASVEVRAARRVEQLHAKGISANVDAIRTQIAARDQQDAGRAIDPLVKAADAVVIDTSDLTPGEVIARMLSVVETCRSRA
jgi:cytidylate kinase